MADSFIILSVNLIINLLRFLSILIHCQRKFSMRFLHKNLLSFVLSGKMFLDLYFFLFLLILRLKYLKFSEPQGGKHNAGNNEIYSIDFIIYHFTMPEEHCYLKAAWISYQLIVFAKWFNSSKRQIWGVGVVINYLYTHRITPQ